jgi:hypothetical protein
VGARLKPVFKSKARMMGLDLHRRVISLSVVMLLAVSVNACRIMDKAGGLPEPWIEAAPLGQSAGQWKLIASDTVKLTVTAPGAEKVKLLYKPVVAVERHAELKTLAAPAEGRGEFLLEWRPGPDFVGDVWAEAYYLGGAVKKTEPLPLATEEAISSQAGEIPLDRVGGSVKTDESARSDKLTGGRIEQAPFVEGDPRIWITINAPAFRLTLWQAGKVLARVSRAEEFRISLADIKAGRRAAGHQSPLTDYSVETKPKDTRRSP